MNETATALATSPGAPIVEITDEVKRLVREQIAPDLNQAELDVFLAVCKSRGLNPVNPGQIYAIKRFDSASGQKRMVIQTGVDGIRLMAERTGLYEGQTETEWCDKDLKWMEVWTGDGPPFAARLGVLRKGWDKPVVCVARHRSYVQRFKGKDGNWHDGAQWRAMPDVMLAKCAETLAFRKAFPGMFDAVTVDLEPDYRNGPEPEEPDRPESRVVVDEQTGEVIEEPVSARCSTCGEPCPSEGALCANCEKEIPPPAERPQLPGEIPKISFGDYAGYWLDDKELTLDFLEWFVKNEGHPQQGDREAARAILESRLGGAV